MLNINDTANEKALNAYEAWLDAVQANVFDGKAIPVRVVDGEQFYVERETHAIYLLVSLDRGQLQRNGWCPANRHINK